MEELKKVNCDEWKNKEPGSEYSTPFAIQYSNQIDEALKNCDDILSEIGCGINYDSKQSKMKTLLTDAACLVNYVYSIVADIKFEIDEPLKLNFSKKATETISDFEKILEKIFHNCDPSKKFDATYPIIDYVYKVNPYYTDFVGDDGENYSNQYYKEYVKYIYDNKYDLYESLKIGDLKKSKDTSTIYNKKFFKKDLRLGLIIANIEYVISSICGNDIPFEQIIKYVFPDPSTGSILLNSMRPVDDVFSKYKKTLFGPYHAPIVANIQLSLQGLYNTQQQ